MKRLKNGVAACNIEVQSWDELPDLDAEEDELVVARAFTGTCRGCHVDVEEQRDAQGDAENAREEAVVAKRSYLNDMDPVWRFPSDLQQLLDETTLVEAMLVAL